MHTPYCIASSALSSISTFASSIAPSFISIRESNLGASCLQGPHHLHETTKNRRNRKLHVKKNELFLGQKDIR